MKTNTNTKTKSKAMNEAQLLEVLKRVLPKATDDPKLADRIFSAVEKELKAGQRVGNFQKFCEKVELPDLEPLTVLDVKRQLNDAFGDSDVAVKADRKEKVLLVEVDLPEGKITGQIKVKALNEEAGDEQEVTLKFVPFPVCLPGDKELVWVLGKRENMTPDEASVTLSKLEEEFWASKTGQNLIRKRVADRCFPEFIARVPGGALSASGLKRHYKTPEPIQAHRTLNGPSKPKDK